MNVLLVFKYFISFGVLNVLINKLTDEIQLLGSSQKLD